MEKFNLQKAQKLYKHAIKENHDKAIKQAEENIKLAIEYGHSKAKLRNQYVDFVPYLQKYFQDLGFSVSIVKSDTDNYEYRTLIVSGWSDEENKKRKE